MLNGILTTNKYDGRYYQLEWEATQSIANNTSTISWELKALGGNVSYYMEHSLSLAMFGEYRYTSTNSIAREKGTVATGSFAIKHNDSGEASFSIDLKVACYTYDVNLTASKSNIKLDTIPRAASITSAQDFTDTDNPVVEYSNPAGNAVDEVALCISLTGSKADIAYRAVSKTGSSYTFTLTADEKNILLNNTNSGSNSRSIWFYIRTIIGESKFYKKIQKTFTVTDCAPTIAVSTSLDTETPSVTGGGKTVFIKGFTDVNYYITASAKKGATIKEYKAICGDVTKSTASGTFYNVKDTSIRYWVKDSRGNVATTTFTANELVNYKPLTCNLAVDAPSADGKTVLRIKGNYSGVTFGSAEGALTNWLKLQYRVTTDGVVGAWTTISATPSLNTTNSTYSINISKTDLDYTKKYSFQVRATDLLSTVMSEDYPVKALPVFDWSENDFNFNVPVTMEGNSLSGVIKAMTQYYDLDTQVEVGGNYLSASGSAVLVGNTLRAFFSATRKEMCGVGDVSSETICTLKVSHGGKIHRSYNVGCINDRTGGAVTSFHARTSTDSSILTITVTLSATTASQNKFSGYFAIPVVIDVNKY